MENKTVYVGSATSGDMYAWVVREGGATVAKGYGFGVLWRSQLDGVLGALRAFPNHGLDIRMGTYYVGECVKKHMSSWVRSEFIRNIKGGVQEPVKSWDIWTKILPMRDRIASVNVDSSEEYRLAVVEAETSINGFVVEGVRGNAQAI